MGSEKLEVWVQRLGLYNPASARPFPVPDRHNSGGGIRAAVLVCLFQGETGDLNVFLTKRSSKLAAHTGEVALPGGKREESDKDDVETALREAREEIGLDSSLVRVVAVLEPFYSQHGDVLVPVVGILSNRKAFIPVPCAAEVEAMFHAPLAMFLKDENWRAEEKVWRGDKYLLHCFDYQVGSNKFVILGLTAGILIKVASIVYGRPPEFLVQSSNFWNPASLEYVAKL